MAREDLDGNVFQLVADQLDTGILILDGEDAIVYWNRFMASHSDVDPGAVLGRSLFDVYPALPAALLKRKLALVRTLRTPAFTSWRERPELFPMHHGRTFTGGDGRMRQNLSIVPLADAGGEVRHVCIAVYDASEVASQEGLLREANEQLMKFSQTDMLTGLNNRREMERRLRCTVEDARRHGDAFSLLMIDVDHFKQVNDTFGHAAGDEVLRFMGRMLCGQLRTPDIAARFGGEEFLVCLPRTGAAGARVTAERLRAAVEQSRIEAAPHSLSITISIGAAEWAPGLENFPKLLEQADGALYRAKRGGRNRVVCHEDPED